MATTRKTGAHRALLLVGLLALIALSGCGESDDAVENSNVGSTVEQKLDNVENKLERAAQDATDPQGVESEINDLQTDLDELGREVENLPAEVQQEFSEAMRDFESDANAAKRKISGADGASASREIERALDQLEREFERAFGDLNF